MSKAAITILKADANVTALVPAANIVSLQETQNTAKPYIVIRSGVDDPNTSFSGQNLDDIRLEIFIVADRLYTEGSEKGAYDIGQVVRTSLDGAQGSYGGETIGKVIFMSQDPPYISQDPNYHHVEVHQEYKIFRRQ